MLTPVEGAYGACMLTLVVMDDSASSSSSFAFENIQPIFSIVTLADGNGTISPTGTIQILKGNNKTLSIVPSTGNRVDDILINGESVGAKSQYTFWSVAQHYTLQAIFSPISAPVADFYAEPLSGDVPLIVDFVNTSQNEFSSVQWLFGDNSKSSATSPVHTYAIPGQYTVSLALTGPGGSHTLTKTAYIHVNETCDLSIQFYANKRTVAIQTDIQMTGVVSDSLASLTWDFGDGTTSHIRNPSHAYSTPGIYNVSLTATSDAKNCSATTIKSKYIQVVGRAITGQVRADGNAVANCLISLWYNESRMLDFALSNENGAYTLNNLPAIGGLVLSVMPPSSMRDQYNTQYYPDALLFSEAERISTQDQDLNLIIDLIEPPDNGICGQILIDSQGVADAQVTIFSESLGHARTVLSDDQGNYTITKLPLADDYVVNAYIDSINQDFYYAIPQDETPGEFVPQSSVTRITRATQIEPGDPWLHHINIIMQNGIISGTVVSDGQPVSNVMVYAWSDEVNCNNFCATNVNGQYTITGLIAVSDTDAPTKGYIVELQSAGFPYQVFDNQTDIELATPIATGRQNVDFQLYSDRKVSGCVTDINYSPLSGAFIQIESDSSDTRAQTYSDNNGNYTFTNLPVASDYYIYAFVQSYPLQYYLNADNRDDALAINLFDDHATNINFMMDKGAVIKGQVTLLESGQPVGEGIWVNIWSENTRSGGDVPTDSNGSYEISGLDADADDYVISIWDEDYINVFYSSSGAVYQYSEVTPVAPSDVNRNLTLTPGYCIAGKITYNNAPVDGIQVWADGPTTGTSSSAATVVNEANYEICGLSPGNYDVNISSDQYLDSSYVETVSIIDSNQTGINFSLELPTRILGGTIYHADMTETVRLYARSNDCQEIIRITGTGEPVAFTFSNLRPSSDYRLEIRPDNHDYQVYNNQTDLTQGTIIDLSTENVNGIEITLTRSAGEIKGLVQFPEPLINHDSVILTAFFNQNQHVSVDVSPGSGGNVPYALTGLGLVTDCEVRLTSDYYEQQVKIINTNDSQPDNAVNFILTPGGSLLGNILNADNAGVSGANVMVWSDQLSMGATTQTDSDGNYQIGGLNAAPDYDVSVQDDTTTFYYHPDGTVVQASKKGTVALNQGQRITGIDIQMFEGEKIEGTVRNTNGAPLANVYISIDLGQEPAGSATTNQQGQYRIDNLQSALNYSVKAIPDSDSGYIKQVKHNVQSNSLQVDFMLQQGYSLRGTIMRWDQTPVANAEIEISSIAEDSFPMPVISDNQGNYEIKGLPGASDYFLQVTPPGDSNLSTYQNQNLMIEDHTILQVTLSSALSISGTIKVSDEGEIYAYTQSARINVYSNDGFNEFTESNSDGTFILNHVPDTTDYTITVYADGYVDQSLYQIFAGETVNIVLSAAKQVSGIVTDSRGVAISGARVEMHSDMVNIPSQVTLDDGSFIFERVPKYFNGVLIEDYSLLVTASGYPDTQKNNISLDTSITIVLDADASLFIEGTVTDFDSNPLPDGYSVNVRLYEKNRNSDNVHMKIKKAINIDGTFKFTGLDANKTYKLKFKQFDNNGAVQLQEYAGENNVGVDKKQDAIFYSPGDTVNFRFSEVWH
jgi:PKD repeat protein